MIKKIFTVLLCFATYAISAQNGTVSPYSFFGIGELRGVSTVESQAMGGLNMYGDSIHINLNNPAAYAGLKLTAYTIGFSHKQVKLKSATEKQSSSVTNLDYLAIGLPISSKGGIGFGLMPYSSVGYSLVSESEDNSITNLYSGEGGLNTAYLSLGYELIKNFSLGATINFNFGTLENQRLQTVENVQLGTIDRRLSKINGFDFNLAANYTPKIGDKNTLYASLMIDTQSNLVSENNQVLGSISTTTGQDIEVLDINLDALSLRNTELKVPAKTTIGLGYGENKKWFLGAEYSFQKLSSFSNDFMRIDNIVYQDAKSIAVGGHYIPDYTSFTNYFKRVTYRAGFRKENTGMVINNEEINNSGITFGLGLPLGARNATIPNFSTINIGFEIGKRGTTKASLIKENYFKAMIGLTLNDKWFGKRKIN